MPNRSWIAVFVAVAATFAGAVLSLSQNKHFYTASGCFVVAATALILAYIFARRTLHCDAILMFVFPQPNLSKATGDPGLRPPWIMIENRGKDDAFDVHVRNIKHGDQEIGFHTLPIVASAQPQFASPQITYSGKISPIPCAPMRLIKLLELGERKPDTNYNQLTEVEIEFKDKDGFRYIAKNVLDFHLHQSVARVFYAGTRRA